MNIYKFQIQNPKLQIISNQKKSKHLVLNLIIAIPEFIWDLVIGIWKLCYQWLVIA